MSSCSGTQRAQPQAKAIRKALLRWYDPHRRRLPWRKTRDPYRIWVSEVMLQQTRAQAVIPYYEKFLNRFPDVKTLAAADEPSLLACWSGLGYYSRARNLRQAAQTIVREHGSCFPRDLQAALALPGVGDYTARAVLSIAYEIPLSVLDGNVARVLSRLYTCGADPKSTRGKKKLLQLADTLLSRQRPGDFNQAMMELGATVCVPRQPRCPACPLRRSCRAYLQNQVTSYPLTRTKSPPQVRRFLAALIWDGRGRCLLARRPEAANWMGGFWELPLWEVNSQEVNSRDRQNRENRYNRKEGIILGDLLGRLRHSITTNQIEVAVYEGRLARRPTARRERWVRLDQIEQLPITTITRKALALPKQHPS
ncbi:MAG: A/G-specific adenine glycosylase [Acidobacteria bacterium]|nr:A/G-specific adenine glycosylase [Acidobacteriota bacterium]